MRSVRRVMIFTMAFSLVIMGVVMFFMFQDTDSLQFEGKTFQQLIDEGQLVPIIVVPLVTIIMIGVVWSIMRSVAPAAIKNGISAPARVLEVRDTGVTVNDNPQIALLLEITPRDRALFQSEVKTIVSRLNVALVQPGTQVTVVYDPQNLKRIQISEMDLDSTPRSDAESRLKELNRLYDQGLINGDEYRSKREEILKKI